MTISDIDPTLSKILSDILTAKLFDGDWENLKPKLKARIRQIIESYYKDNQDCKTTDHIVNINTNVREIKPDEQDVNGLMSSLDNLIDLRFKDSPPFTILRIAELVYSDQTYSTPIKFLKALFVSFNVVTTLEGFERRNKLHYQLAIAADEKNHDPSADEKVKILPIQTERGGETKTVVMTEIPWINEVDDDDDDDDDGDYVEDEVDDGGSGSESDDTDNDNDSQSQEPPNDEQEEEEEEEETSKPPQEEPELPEVKNQHVEKLKGEDISSQSPKNKKEQLNSPNIKRRKSDVNIKDSDESDVSMSL